jgi:DNA-binding XRE family transcriptional regulator
MTRSRDRLIDKKIGSLIRMQRVKLGMSQSELGNALGVTFQQIQKYESGGNAVASTRIPDLCRTPRPYGDGLIVHMRNGRRGQK